MVTTLPGIAVLIAPFHRVSPGSFTTLHPLFLFCFTLLRSLQPVLRHRYSGAPLLARLANRAHTRTRVQAVGTPNGISVGSFFALTVARSTVANCEYAHYRYLQTRSRARARVHSRCLLPFHISTESTNRSIPPRSRFLLSNPPAPPFSLSPHLDAQGVLERKESLGNVPFLVIAIILIGLPYAKSIKDG